MLDLNYFRNNFDRVAERLSARGSLPQLDQFRELDQRRRAAISHTEKLKARVNGESAAIGKLKREGVDTTAKQEEVRGIKAEIASLGEQLESFETQFHDLLAGIPNIPHESVPAGKPEADNVEVRRSGKPPEFDFE